MNQAATTQTPHKLIPRRQSIAGGIETDESFVQNNMSLAAWLLDRLQSLQVRDTSQDFGTNHDGQRYQAVESTICGNCAFIVADGCEKRDRSQLPCGYEDRADGRSVHWIEVTQ